ncbi:AT hook domain-containing protein [Colletotrichum tofieldiae]|uniref:AT hook domain-containing protein n=1 Tax=Colletotrichum tofieldiae TaxID=708197 RepID=A0A161WN75_9PEZI|nr:AT hook domain-containing protein [Colletotrichum tofieldiae]
MENASQSRIVSPRRTRQGAKLAEMAAASSIPSQTSIAPVPSTTRTTISGAAESIRQLPEILGPNFKAKALRKTGLQLLLTKRQLLVETPVIVPSDMERKGLASSVMATLVFAQEEAGTAVCISPGGILLTCSHCIAETADEFDSHKSHWLLFASGQVVEAKPLAWDAKRDLALLKIIAAQPSPALPSAAAASSPPFPFITPSPTPPPLQTRLICIGHPGSEDLEAADPGTKTDYGVLHLSIGTFRGCAAGQDPQDNSEIGALMHTCWTYWGHSGAPLLERRTGMLVGLHSSWDDETGMRRGVAWEAVVGFLEENQQLVG